MTETEKTELFRKQKEMLDTFLQKNAISKEQYEKSLYGLRTKMGIKDNEPDISSN